MAAIADHQRLRELEKINEELTGPSDTAISNGKVSKGAKFGSDLIDDSTAAIIRSFDKLNNKLKAAQEDSTTPYGILISRFKTIDSDHKYLSATYTGTGHLLTFHSEVTNDDKHKQEYDLYFDKGKLRYISEQRTYTTTDADDEQVDMSTCDAYYMSGSTLLYAYRDEAVSPQKKDHIELMKMFRYTLQGDARGHAARAYGQFLRDYQLLMAQPMERMIYTPMVKTPIPEAPPEKPLPKRNQIPIVVSE